MNTTPVSRSGRPVWLTAVAIALQVIYVIASNVAVSQYTGQQLGYDPALGPAEWGPFYVPWAWVRWTILYYSQAPGLFGQVVMIGTASNIAGFLVYALFIGLGVRRSRGHAGVHGTAHFAATVEEVRATGLIPAAGEPGAGVYVGAWTDRNGTVRYLRHDGPEHVAAIAPTRSGKGLGLVIPTLLSWPHSCVVNDQKDELWNLTSGWRSREGGNRVIRFDPAAAEGSAGFNPLEECRVGTIHEVSDVQNTVTIIVDPQGNGLVDHWSKTAHAFLTGVILHLQYKALANGTTASLPDVADALSDPSRPIDDLYKEMLSNQHSNGQLHVTVAQAARDMLNRPGEERGSVLSTAMSFMTLYRDPLVAGNVRSSSFKIGDLMNSAQPVTLYLVVREEHKDRLKPLSRLIVNQIVRVLLRPSLQYQNGRPLMPHKHRMLLMIDELPSLGKLELLEEALSYIAGYGIKAYLVMQDIAQLWGAYGQHEAITSNCHVRVAYAPNKIETAKWLSDTCGVTTIVKEDISTSGGRFAALLQNITRTFHEVQRPLITPDEVMRLKAATRGKADLITEAGELLVMLAGHAPIRGTQSLYFRDPVFSSRIQPPATIGHAPTSSAKVGFTL